MVRTESVAEAYEVETQEEQDVLDKLKTTVHRRLLSETEFSLLQRMTRDQWGERIRYLTEQAVSDFGLTLPSRTRANVEQEVIYEVLG